MHTAIYITCNVTSRVDVIDLNTMIMMMIIEKMEGTEIPRQILSIGFKTDVLTYNLYHLLSRLHNYFAEATDASDKL